MKSYHRGEHKSAIVYDDFVFKYYHKEYPRELYECYYDVTKYCISKDWRVADCFGVDIIDGILGVRCEYILPCQVNHWFGDIPDILTDKTIEFIEWYDKTLNNLSGNDKELFKIIFLEVKIDREYEIIYYPNVGMKNGLLYNIDISLTEEENIDHMEHYV